MKKIFILGGVASGKTTLSRRLSAALQIPATELDGIVYDDSPDRKKHSPEQQIALLEKIDARGSWICEGTFRDSYANFLAERADLVVILSLPLRIRLYRVFMRFARQMLGMEKSLYRPSFGMLRAMVKWALDENVFEQQYRPKLDFCYK